MDRTCARRPLSIQAGTGEWPLSAEQANVQSIRRNIAPDSVNLRVALSRKSTCRLTVLPHHAIHARCGFAFERVERCPEQVDIHVVEERGELLLLPLPCGFSYAVQRLGHASPALRPVRALLVRVSLGPRPWLHQLRRRSPGFVRRLRRYYAGVRLLWIVHQRLRLLTFPLRTIRPQQRLWPIQRSPGSRARGVRTCQGLRPRRVRQALALTRLPVLPSVK